MRTKTKLTLVALGFVAANTVLALWQSAPPRLETVAHRFSRRRSLTEDFYFLSPKEVLTVSGGTLLFRSVEDSLMEPLPAGLTEPPLPISPHSLSSLDDSWNMLPLLVTRSPDRKWLLFKELVRERHKPATYNWLLVHPDGTGLRRIALPSDIEASGSKPLWLPDSSGWIVFWNHYQPQRHGQTFFSVQLTISSSEKPGSRPDFQISPEVIQADGRLLFRDGKDKTAFTLCDLDKQDRCESLKFSLPSGREKAEVLELLVSYDSQTALMRLKTEATIIPDRQTWEVLLKRELPVGYEELWVLSRASGKSRCLVRESLMASDDSAFCVESFSQDGKQALVWSGQRDNYNYYLLTIP